MVVYTCDSLPGAAAEASRLAFSSTLEPGYGLKSCAQPGATAAAINIITTAGSKKILRIKTFLLQFNTTASLFTGHLRPGSRQCCLTLSQIRENSASQTGFSIKGVVLRTHLGCLSASRRSDRTKLTRNGVRRSTRSAARILGESPA